MKIKLLFSIFLVSYFFFSCQEEEKNYYILKGKINGLNNNKIIIASSDTILGEIHIDTITCSAKGQFEYKNSSDSLVPIIVYLEEGTIWTTVWAQNGDKIDLGGNVMYPELLIAKGGEVNNALARFKEAQRTLLIEKRDLLNKAESLETVDSVMPESSKHEYAAKISNIDNQLRNEAGIFIKDHPTSIASLVLFQDYLFDAEAPRRNQEYLDIFSGAATTNELYFKFSDINKTLLKTVTGAKAPDFKIVEMTSKDTLSLSSFNNQYLLLAFSASWCESCTQELDSLLRLRKIINKKELAILTVTLDNRQADWEEIVKNKKMDWYQAIDSLGWDKGISNLYNIQSIPANFLINKDKIIVGKDLLPDSIISKLK